VIEACLELRQEHGLSADDIRRVTVTGQRLLLERGDRAVANERDARVSIHHSAAAAFLWGAAGIDEFSTEKVMDPRTVAFRRKVFAARDDAMPVGAARVTVETARGASHTASVIYPRGSIEAPLSDDEIAAKVRALGHRGSPRCAVDRVIELVWRLDDAADIEALMRETRAA
jgi:2-methylcitrate dehydratase PrpD